MRKNSRKSYKKTWKETTELIVFVVIAITLAYGINTGIRAYSGAETSLVVVETGSMQPTLVGIYVFDGETHTTHWSPISADMLFIKKTPPKELQLGDIIVFEDPREGEIPIVHRIVEKYEKDGIYYFRTTGDNPWTNSQVDWWEIPQNRVIGKVIARVPRIGYFQLSIQTRLGRLLLLLAIILLVGSMLLYPDTPREPQTTENQKESPPAHIEAKSHEEESGVSAKNLVFAFLIFLVITTPILVNTVEVMSHQNGGKILSVDIKPNRFGVTQLSVKISLWSGGYFWQVLDNATIHIMDTKEPEYVWKSPYRWSGTKTISADFLVELNALPGTSIMITLKTYFYNVFGVRWVEEVSKSIPAR